MKRGEDAAAKKGRKEFSYKRYNKIVYETCDPKKEGKKKCLFNSTHNKLCESSRVGADAHPERSVARATDRTGEKSIFNAFA